MAVISCEKIFQISSAKLDAGKHKLTSIISNRTYPLRAEEIYFELNGYGTENVAMATKLFTYFCLLQVLLSIR